MLYGIVKKSSKYIRKVKTLNSNIIKLNNTNIKSSFLTVQEIADDLGTNVNYVYDLIACDKIDHIQIGRSYKIKKQWYDDFLENYKNKELPHYKELEIEARKARKLKEAA